MTTAFNLSTGERREYTLSPEDAAIAAYAQSRGDWSTWDYRRRYSGLVVTGAVCVTVGNWSAFRRAEQERLWGKDFRNLGSSDKPSHKGTVLP